MHYPLISQSNQRPVHFLEGYCEHLAQQLGLAALRPMEFRGSIYLSLQERQAPPAVAPPYWLLNAGSKTDFTCKQWPVARYQEVVDRLAGRIQFVQIGAEDPGHRHPRLRGVVDRVGRTSIRELVLLMHHAAGVLTGVSFPMHLAAAVPRPQGAAGLRPCVVVAGGREPVHWEQYPGHQFLHTIGQLPCCAEGGCWRSRVEPLDDGSDQDGSLCERPMDGYPQCMASITVNDVLRQIEGFVRF
jgi:ADP-heptose:LPS heptosyltransferase